MAELSGDGQQQPVVVNMNELLGDRLMKPKNGGYVSTIDALKGKDLVLLYFSASWCPPCQGFSPILKDFYGIVQQPIRKDKKGKDETISIEIIYVSSDRSVTEFQTYYGTMPWLAIPMDTAGTAIKRQLASLLQIQGIPSLVVLDAQTGQYVTNTARTDIQNGSGNVTKYREILQKWKLMDSVPIELAFNGTSNAFFSMKSMILGIAKNPIYIFGTYYIIKTIILYMKNYWAPNGDNLPPLTGNHRIGASIMDESDEVIPEDEF